MYKVEVMPFFKEAYDEAIAGNYDKILAYGAVIVDDKLDLTNIPKDLKYRIVKIKEDNE